jgi:hypothetical protein
MEFIVFFYLWMVHAWPMLSFLRGGFLLAAGDEVKAELCDGEILAADPTGLERGLLFLLSSEISHLAILNKQVRIESGGL